MLKHSKEKIDGYSSEDCIIYIISWDSCRDDLAKSSTFKVPTTLVMTKRA